jgi:hypothetical protein
LICFSITTVSLWIDEGYTAWIVAHNTLGSVVAALANSFQETAADRQYPLYVLWIWSWAHVFGSSELALRSANAPFGILYVLALALTCRYVLLRRFAWIPFAFAPFVWFYMNEARSYLMLASLATAATGAMIAYVYGPQAFRPRAVWLLGGFAFLALLTNILAVFLFPGLGVLAIASLRTQKPQLREWLAPALIVGPLMALTLIFYALTFAGMGGRDELQSNHRAYPSFAFAAQVLYEDAGFDGLGPPRNDLRSQPTKTARGYIVYLLLGLTTLTLAVFLALRTSYDARFLVLLGGWLVSLLLAIVTSSLLHSRFLGRHMAAPLPLLLFSLMTLLRYRISLTLLAAVFVVSDVRMSVLPQYWKDDYRSAVHDVISRAEHAPGAIDWAADDRTANYYGLGLTHPGSPGYTRYLQLDRVEEMQGVSVLNLTPQGVDALLKSQRARAPVYLALSKSDIFDGNRGWQQAIERDHPAIVAVYRAFTIYRFSATSRTAASKIPPASEPRSG